MAFEKHPQISRTGEKNEVHAINEEKWARAARICPLFLSFISILADVHSIMLGHN
jgi:hypothetical protein